MTVEEAEAALDAIRKEADDPEGAHISEDALRESILRAIADGADNPVELAKIALRTSDIQFPRWYA